MISEVTKSKKNKMHVRIIFYVNFITILNNSELVCVAILCIQ